MRRAAIDHVVGFLGFSLEYSDRLKAIQRFDERQWKYVLQWLADAGLAFYFLRRLEEANAGGGVPPWVLSRLERNFASNQLRIHGMAQRFGALNQRFNEAGVHFAAIKGFSLVPQFCPDAALRHQADLDYLVDEQSLPAASRILIEAGYRPQVSRSSKESIFVFPGAEPSRGDDQYSPDMAHAVELHADVWDSKMHRLPPIPHLFSVAQSRTRDWNGFTFPAQRDEDAFLLQVLHACRHVFTQWIRLSCLFEIAYFLQRRASDSLLWDRIAQRVGNNAMLREFVVVVTEMAAQIFSAPIPELVQDWDATVRPGPRTWIQHYARDWALGGMPVYEFSVFPSAKLAVFLHQQYTNESETPHSQHEPEAPSSRLSRMTSSIKRDPSVVLRAAWWRRQHLVRRSAFHALAEMRYAVEIPRWHWLNRAYRQAGPALSAIESLASKKAS